MNRVAISIILCSCLALSCTTTPPPPPQPPAQVNLYAVKAQPVYYYDRYPGTTQGINQVNIYPEVQGYITGIFFKEGAHVKKGQLLYEIDKRLFKAAYDQAEANQKVAHGTTVQAQQDADRYTYLNKQKAVAEQLYDHAVIALDNARNAEKAADEAVKTAKTNLAYSEIYAPFDGTIGFSQVKLGNMVTVGQTLLNTISTDNPMSVDFLVNEKQLASFENMEKNGHDQIDSLFTLVMPDGTLYPSPGKISIIDRAVDPQTGAIRVRLDFPNPDDVLKVGMSCVVRVHNLERTPQMVIPNRAVLEQMGEYFVFVKKDTMMAQHGGGQGADAKKDEKGGESKKGEKDEKVLTHVALQRKVQLGMTIGPNIIVKSGIDVGDSIVVDGVQNLHDGSKIVTGVKRPAADSTKKSM